MCQPHCHYCSHVFFYFTVSAFIFCSSPTCFPFWCGSLWVFDFIFPYFCNFLFSFSISKGALFSTSTRGSVKLWLKGVFFLDTCCFLVYVGSANAFVRFGRNITCCIAPTRNLSLWPPPWAVSSGTTLWLPLGAMSADTTLLTVDGCCVSWHHTNAGCCQLTPRSDDCWVLSHDTTFWLPLGAMLHDTTLTEVLCPPQHHQTL